MMNPDFWKAHYVIVTESEEIASTMRFDVFTSIGERLELVHFRRGQAEPNILISPGSGGHALIFAELAYCLYRAGFNVFIMPKHGGRTISELMVRHNDALDHIGKNFSAPIGVFSEGLGGFVTFYLALAKAPFRSAIYQNSPALLTEAKFHDSVLRGRRKVSARVAQLLSKLSPNIKIPISAYLGWRSLIDPKEPSHAIESRLVREGYLKDPDFDRSYPLSAVLSLLYTPPPAQLSELIMPTMFLVAVRGVGGTAYVDYLRDLYRRLPAASKKLVEVDGGAYWMLSHPQQAAAEIGGWFTHTLY
jgi:hypothetical protein